MNISLLAPRVVSGRGLLALALTALLGLGTVSLVALSPTDAHAAGKPKLSSTSKKVIKGKTFTLTVKNTAGKKVAWKSSNKKVATVSKKGKVTAKKAGTATITAKVGGKKLTCTVKVYGSAKQKALASLNGWWHTWSAGGSYVYIKNGYKYTFPVSLSSDGLFVYKTSNVSKNKVGLTRVKYSPTGYENPAYRVKAGRMTYYYNDSDHQQLEAWDGTSFSGSSSLERVKASEVPSNLKKYVKKH